MKLTENLALDVPLHEKDQAKAMGVRPQYHEGKFLNWYLPANLDILPFQKWWTDEFRKEMEKQGVITPAPEPQKPTGQSLSSVLAGVQKTVKEAFSSPIWIRAEIIGINDKGPNTYIELGDYDSKGSESAKARGMIWSSDRKIVSKFRDATGLELKPGMKILFQALVEFTPKFGLTLRFVSIDPTFTLGDMELKIAAIKKSLQERGIYDLNKRLPRPFDYQKVFVISPADAAGLGDFKTQADHIMQLGLCKFRYATATFSGPDCVRSIVAAVSEAARWAPKIDAVVIIRGGGDKAGLYALNELEIVEAACQLKCPVVVGIGHDRDNTILDEIANIRCPTPSLVIAQIINTIVQNAQACRNNMSSIQNQLSSTLARARNKADSQYSEISVRTAAITKRARTLANQDLDRVGSEIKRVVAVARQKAAADIQLIYSHNPINVLQRGYTIARNPDGQVLTSASQATNQKIHLTFKDGTVSADVKESI